MKARAITQQVLQKKDSKLGRILLFTGARQTGKTTLVQNALRDYRYISVEDPRMRGTYESLTASQWNALYPKAIVDEVQKVPSLMESIKSVYDTYPQTRYALLGSSQILLLNKIHETLAGRCSILELYPLTLPELRTHAFEETVEKSLFQTICLGERDVHDELLPSFLLDTAVEEKQRAYDHYLTFGGYPAVSDEELSPAERWDWLDNYARTYLERDIADLATLRELDPFLKLRKIMALETGTLLNTEAIGRQIGCTGKTVKRYIQYLSLSYQSITLEPWARNPLRRLMKTPKIHFLDPGILKTIVEKRNELRGEEYESAIIAEIYKQLHVLPIPKHVYHLRTQDGFEINLLIELEHGYYAFEIKQTAHVHPTDARHLKNLPPLLDKPLLHSFILSNDPTLSHISPTITAIHAAQFLA